MKRRILNKFCQCIVTTAFLFSPYMLHAINMQSARFEHISLPYEANVVECICKDHQGMMWFGTRRGLFAYDGYNSRRIIEGGFHAVITVTKNVICLGGDNGLLWLNLHNEQFELPYGNNPETGEVRSIAIHGQRLYIGSKSRGLFALNLKTKCWTHYNLPGGNNDIIFSIEPVGNNIYIGHQSGLALLDPSGKMHDGLVNDNVYYTWYDKKRQCLWIGTEHHLLRRTLKNGKTSIVISGTTINQIVPSPDGKLLMASEFGLKVLDADNGHTQTIAHDAASPRYSLPNNSIHHIFCDSAKNVWIATDRGVAVKSLGNPFHIISLPQISHSHDGNIFTSILIDSKGAQWLGGDNGLLHLTNHSSKWFKVGEGLRKNIIRSIYEDRDHEIWIATDAGIARYNRRQDRFDYFTLTDRQGRNGNWAYDIYEDEKHRLWVATYMGGLYVVDKGTLLSSGRACIEKPLFAKTDDIVNTIYKFCPGKDGILWANTNRGLASIDTKTLHVTLKQKMYLDNMIVVDESIWIDVQGQLLHYDIQKNKCEKTDFCLKNGMIHSFVRENNRLWMSTTDGLYFINIPETGIHLYGKPGYNFTAGTYNPPSNEIVWGGEDVICTQSLAYRGTTLPQPVVHLSSVFVAGKPIAHCIPRFAKTLVLTGRDDISLDLASFTYDGKASEVFRYKLNKDGEWHAQPNGNNRITFSHLSGGTYQLYLTTDARYKEQSITVYTLKVPYPWYLRWWAWIIYATTVSVFIYLVLSYYKRREQRLFEQRERERTMTLTQQKIDFFVNMSHELKTPLSLIIAPLSKLMSETTNSKLRNSLKLIHTNAERLNGLVHRILDYKRMETESEDTVLATHEELGGLLKECIGEFAALASERSITIDFHADSQPIWLDIDKVKIQTVVRNILSNALKYARSIHGEIRVGMSSNKKEVIITISDNGNGVASNELDKIFNRYYRGRNVTDNGSGIGLSIVKKFVELHDGTVKAENKNGLTITFTLPLTPPMENGTDTELRNELTDIPSVMIVDDNDEILEFLTTALENSYHCLTASCGEKALKMLKTQVPDIIITDQMMPGIDGAELCNRIRHNHATALVPIIMLTAKDDAETELKSIRRGADVFMAKPFDLRKLQLHIVQLLHRRKAIEQSTRIEQMTEQTFEASAPSDDEKLMERIIDAIEENMQSEDFNVTRLAELMHIEPKQLYRKMKLLTGETPVVFIRKQRMKRAAALLRQQRFTVSEIMYQVGFCSSSYFTKTFAKEFGVSPKDYK